MNAGKRMIEEARRQHAENAKVNPFSFTFNKSLNKVIGTEEQIRAEMKRRNDQDNRNVYNRLGAKEYARATYSTLCFKQFVMYVGEQICATLAASNVTDTKPLTREFKHIVDDFNDRADEEAEGIPELIAQLTQWWMQESLNKVVNAQHYAYANELMRTISSIQNNTADLGAWLLTLRDMCRSSKEHDDEHYKKVAEIMRETGGISYRNPNDPCYALDKVIAKFIVSMFGRNIEPTSPDIERGKQTIRNQLYIFSPYELAVEHYAHKAITKSKHQCPADRCAQCDLHPCKTFKAVDKALQKSL